MLAHSPPPAVLSSHRKEQVSVEDLKGRLRLPQEMQRSESCLEPKYPDVRLLWQHPLDTGNIHAAKAPIWQ